MKEEEDIMMQTESFSNSLYTDQMHLAERELSAFIAAVGASHGPEEAALAAEDWIDIDYTDNHAIFEQVHEDRIR